ncbi:hypothetical protein TSAR_015846 [Trichomalopsis sarcophagae]|uniref:Uncharacterized protein n=1 Tax=Trichomalopsis sarcophagae TaxID=543379 RepID=A0A232FG04_9HYME|nr:hypothetical protein TSAR_015846 [Trichomalopsis sarcophagae]
MYVTEADWRFSSFGLMKRPYTYTTTRKIPNAGHKSPKFIIKRAAREKNDKRRKFSSDETRGKKKTQKRDQPGSTHSKSAHSSYFSLRADRVLVPYFNLKAIVWVWIPADTNLHTVGGDDLAAKTTGQLDAQLGFTGAGGTQDHQDRRAKIESPTATRYINYALEQHLSSAPILVRKSSGIHSDARHRWLYIARECLAFCKIFSSSLSLTTFVLIILFSHAPTALARCLFHSSASISSSSSSSRFFLTMHKRHSFARSLHYFVFSFNAYTA